MDALPLESDVPLSLLVPDALAFLDNTDDDNATNGGEQSLLLGAVDAADHLDAGFLSELLPLEQSDDTSPASLSDAVGSLANAEQQAGGGTARDRRLQRRAVSARLFRERKKSEMETLHKEAVGLSVHLERLRSAKRPQGTDEWEERALQDRRRLTQAEELNRQLKRALFNQRRLVRGILGVLSSSPLRDSEMDLHRVLHTYTRLGSRPQGRIRAFKSVCSESKLDLALQVVDRETEGIPPSISTKRVETLPKECGVTTTAVHSFQSSDVNEIFSDAYLVIVGNQSMKKGHTVTNVHPEVAKPGPTIHYAISDGVYTNYSTGQAFNTTSRSVSFYRVTDEYALLLWDFVDVDDLYPAQESIHMKTDAVGALVVRLEVGVDNVERVVCRYVCTKLHRLNRVAVTSSLEHFILSGAQHCTEGKFRHIEANHAARQLSVYV